MKALSRSSRIFVAGHRGLVGSAIVRELTKRGYSSVVMKARDELNLLDQHAVREFFKKEGIDAVFLAAAKVGGIHANNTYPADFLYENIQIASNVIHSAYESKVEKLLFLGSSCIYPKFAEQPIKETSLLTGALEPTNEAYAIAKIAGLKLCEMYQRQYGCRFISAMPTNLYGPGDNFHPENSHVIPALMRRIHEAKVAGQPKVTIWGTGTPRREFLHCDDLASACVHLMETYDEPQLINVGTGQDVTILDLCDVLREVIGYQGDFVFDHGKPDGTPRKLLDVTRIHERGWKAKISLRDGLKSTYQWALENQVFISRT